METEPPRYRAWLIGFAGVVALILCGGGQHPFAAGLALLLPGLWVLAFPPKWSFGGRFDACALALMCLLLGAFLPQFLLGAPEWRKEAVDAFGIALPGSMSVQPWVSFEGWMMALAGLVWFYAVLSTPLNFSGRVRIYFVFSCVMAVIAAIIIWGNLNGLRYPGAESAHTFTFFPNRNQSATVLAMAGVIGFGFAMEGLRTRKLVHLAGLAATALCLFALVIGVSRAGVLLYFLGIFVWFLFRLRRTPTTMFVKLGLPAVLVIFSAFISSNARVVERVTDFVALPSLWLSEGRVPIYRDTINMIGDAPLFGVGLGNFSAIFPQFRDLSRNYQAVIHPESDWLWLSAEAGVIAAALVGICVVIFFKSCRGAWGGKSGAYRLVALTAAILFLAHSLVDVSGHRSGSFYFAALLGVLALPKGALQRTRIPAMAWRGTGLALSVVGTLWAFGALASWPTHSKLAAAETEEAVNAAVALEDYTGAERILQEHVESRPFKWRAYFRLAQMNLSGFGDRAEAAANFRRARFVEPNLGVVSFEEGLVWMPIDPGRAISAWRETLFRDVSDRESTFRRMMILARNNKPVMDRVVSLSNLDRSYRLILLNSLKGEAFMTELNKELKNDPGLAAYPVTERTGLVERWILHGDPESASAFLDQHPDSVVSAWWLRSLVHKDAGNFEPAVRVIRESIEPYAIPDADVTEGELARLERAFRVSPRDVTKGTALLRIYLDRGDYGRALKVVDRLCALREPPEYALYWKAEILYRLNDFIESWYAFETLFSYRN